MDEEDQRAEVKGQKSEVRGQRSEEWERISEADQKPMISPEPNLDEGELPYNLL